MWDSIIMIVAVLETNLKMYTEDARYLVQVYVYFTKYFQSISVGSFLTLATVFKIAIDRTIVR